MRSDKGPWNNPEIMQVSYFIIFFYYFTSKLIMHFHLQRVKNGDHKCTKRSQAENGAEETIFEVLLTYICLNSILFLNL